MKFTNAEKLVKGLRSRGVILIGASFQIVRDRGQPMMNKAAGEAAPTWYLYCDPLWYLNRVADTGHKPDVVWDGETKTEVEICSHMPLIWILKYPPEEWEINWEDMPYFKRLNIFVGDLPPTWK